MKAFNRYSDNREWESTAEIKQVNKLGGMEMAEQNKPNIKLFRIDERLIHGQGQLWIKSLGVNLVICANDKVADNPIQQSLMKSVIPKGASVRFWTLEKTAEVIWKAAPRQSIFVVVESPEDALKLADAGFPIDEINVGNVDAKDGKEKLSQFVYLGDEDKSALKALQDKYNATFTTKTSPVANEGNQHHDKLLEMINN